MKVGDFVGIADEFENLGDIFFFFFQIIIFGGIIIVFNQFVMIFDRKQEKGGVVLRKPAEKLCPEAPWSSLVALRCSMPRSKSSQISQKTPDVMKQVCQFGEAKECFVPALIIFFVFHNVISGTDYLK